MEFTKPRYSTKEAQHLLGLKNTAYWLRVRDGRLRIQHDGGRAFVTAAELQRYIAACEAGRETVGA